MKILINEISKKFGDITLFDKSSMEIENNGLFSIIGESGCGKTTLLNIMLKRDTNYSGDVLLDNVNIKDISEYDFSKMLLNKIGLCMQNTLLLDALTVSEYIRLQIPEITEEYNKRFEETTKKLNINDLLNRKCSELSGGQKQRVSICKCILDNKEILILDEPTSSQDSKNAENIFSILKNESSCKTIFLISHDYKRVMNYCDVVWELKNKTISKVKYTEKNELNEATFNTQFLDNNKLIDKICSKTGLVNFSISSICNSIVLSFAIAIASIGSFNYVNEVKKITHSSENVKICNKGSLNSDYIYNGKDIIDSLNRENIEYAKVYEDFNDLSILSYSNNDCFDEKLVFGSYPQHSNEYIIEKNLYFDITGNDYYDLSSVNNLLDEIECVGIFDDSLNIFGIHCLNFDPKYEIIPCNINTDVFSSFCMFSNNNDISVDYGTKPTNYNEIVVSSVLLNSDQFNNYDDMIGSHIQLDSYNDKNQMDLSMCYSDELVIVGIIDDGNPFVYINDELYTLLTENYSMYFAFDYLLTRNVKSGNYIYLSINENDVLKNLAFIEKNIMAFRPIFWLISLILIIIFCLLSFKKILNYFEINSINIQLLLNMGVKKKTIITNQLKSTMIANILTIIVSTFLSIGLIYSINTIISSLFGKELYFFGLNLLALLVSVIIYFTVDIILMFKNFKRRTM